MTETDFKRTSPTSSVAVNPACNGSMPGLNRGSEAKSLSLTPALREIAASYAARFERNLPPPADTLA